MTETRTGASSLNKATERRLLVMPEAPNMEKTLRLSMATTAPMGPSTKRTGIMQWTHIRCICSSIFTA